MPVSVEIRVLRAGDAGVLARVRPDVFDHAIDARAAEEFLADARHHLAVAIEAGEVVGFASAVHYVHPDRAAPELWINEIGVTPDYRRRGVGKALLHALLDVARELECAEAWVGTDRDNAAANRLYASLGGRADEFVMYTFRL